MKAESLWIGVGVGCALMIVCGMCIAGAGAVYVVRSGDEMGLPTPPAPVVQGPGSPTTTPPTPPPTTPPVVGPATPIGPGAPSGGGELRRVRATVTASNGLADVPVGSSCTADVTRHDREDGPFWCNAQIPCGPRLVFGGADAGFFQCVLYEGARRDVVGSDSMTTNEDQDAAMSLNTVGGTLEVWDDATGRGGQMRMTARVDAIE